MNAPAATAARNWTAPRKGLGMSVVIGALVLVALLLTAHAWGWLPRSGGETTEDAYVRGRTAVIAPQVSGYVVEVLVKDYRRVEAGDVLVRIDDRSYKAKVEQAQANLEVAQANLANNEQARSSSIAAL